MTIVMLALLIALAAATAIVLADSGLRLWSAAAGIRAQRSAISGQQTHLPATRLRQTARVTTRISYARPSLQPVPQRAAA